MPTSTITSKGQITIPKEVREKLGLREGDRIDFLVDSNGNAILKPASFSFRQLKGILHRKNRKTISVEKMNEAIRYRWKKKA